MNERVFGRGTGWLPDYPDVHDYTVDRGEVSPRLRELGERDSVRAMLAKSLGGRRRGGALPATADLRRWCSRVEDQGEIGSCTAHAASSLVEYFERRAFGSHTDVARLFVYKTTRNLMRADGDTGAFIRTAMGALVLFGAPPEEYWPYRAAAFDREPPAFCYAFARSYRAVSYYRLDSAGTTPKELLLRLRTNLAAGLPAMFGFTVYGSIGEAADSGRIPFPNGSDEVVGGHAVAAVGYDDRMKIRGVSPGSPETTGAFLVRNSWGASWGDKGYGWLPYAYVLEGLADDVWSLLKNEWIDTGRFKA